MHVVPTVYLIDDDEPARMALRFLLETAGVQVESFASAETFILRDAAAGSGCVVTDMRMPGTSGLDLLRTLSDRGVDLPVIMLTAYGDVRMAVLSMKAGAFDFIEKPYVDKELLESVRRALQDASTRNAGKQSRAAMAEKLATLTQREHQTLDLIVEGEPNKRIAFTLGISEKTVEFHRAHIMRKMGARSSADLIRMVVEADAPPEKPSQSATAK
jgi:two-component system, LuxR family, response regulator FixJ